MKYLLSLIAKLLYRWGIESAGSASMRGTYEAPVPEQLRNGTTSLSRQ